MNKKGMVLFEWLEGIAIIMFIAITVGGILFVINTATFHIGNIGVVGNVDMGNITNLTLGRMNIAFTNTADLIGMTLIFGMILSMLGNAYYFGGKYPKLFFILDFFILIFGYILAVYVQRVYSIFINATDLFAPIFINNLPNTSKFILNLPPIVTTIGVIMLILGYSGIRKLREGRGGINVMGQ